MDYAELKKRATELRKSGYSYTYIHEKINISKSTLSNWLSGVKYTPNEHTISTIGKARTASGLFKNRQKILSIREARLEAKKELGDMDRRDLFMLGLGIYMGEGTKYGDTVRVINANPKILRLTIRWFKECLGLRNDNFRIRIHLYPDNNVDECLGFWAKETGIPRSNFQKTQIDCRKKDTFKRGKLPYGTAHLTVKSNGEKNSAFFSLGK